MPFAPTVWPLQNQGYTTRRHGAERRHASLGYLRYLDLTLNQLFRQLAQTNRLGGNFDQFVLADVFQSSL